MAVSIPHCVVKSDRLSLDDDWLREDNCFEAFSFSRHNINLELDEEIMKPEKATKAPRNWGVDPSTMKMKQWYQGQDRLSDESQWQLPSNRASDKKAPTGTDRKMTQRGLRWGTVTCLHQYLNELPIREFEKTEQCRTSNVTRNRCTLPPTKTPTQKHGLIIAEASPHSPCEKQAQTLTFTTCQRTSAASSSPEEWISESWEHVHSDFPKWKVQRHQRPSAVTSQRFLGKQLRACDLDGRGWQLTNRWKGVAWWLWLSVMSFEQKQWPVSPRKTWSLRIYSPFMGIR